jgi:hypothetical protein
MSVTGEGYFCPACNRVVVAPAPLAIADSRVTLRLWPHRLRLSRSGLKWAVIGIVVMVVELLRHWR